MLVIMMVINLSLAVLNFLLFLRFRSFVCLFASIIGAFITFAVLQGVNYV